jgi:hypothetical protein
MSTITLSKAREFVEECGVGDFLYMVPGALPTSLGNAIGVGATVDDAKRDAQTKADFLKVSLDHHQLFRVVSG